MAGNAEQPIIIKRIEDDGHHDHHGGGWKVAYADFMTAMMAFFLLLWILAASDEEKLRGLADYFTPSLSEAGGRGEGMLDGQVLGADGVMSGTDGPQSEIQLPSFGQENPLAVFDSRLREEANDTVVEYEVVPEGEVLPGNERDPQQGVPSAESIQDGIGIPGELARQQEIRTFELDSLEQEIANAVKDAPELVDLQSNIRFERTPEGLNIDIVDQDGQSMFALGSSRVETRTRDLIRIVGEAVGDLTQNLAITGHTDALPFTRQLGYGNWELSADRANATRRVLIDTGVSPARITRITGLADTDPLIPEDPRAAQNRRISIQLLYPDPALQPQ